MGLGGDDTGGEVYKAETGHCNASWRSREEPVKDICFCAIKVCGSACVEL